MNELKLLVIKFIGQGTFHSKILHMQTKGLLKLGTYCGVESKRKLRIWVCDR